MIFDIWDFHIGQLFCSPENVSVQKIFDAYASNNAQLMIRFNRCLTLKNEWRVAHSIRIMLMWRIVRLISKLWRKAFTPQMLWLLASFDLNNIRAMIKKMSSYQYRKSHRADKTVIRLSYLHNGISPESKMSSMYRTRNHLYGLTCTAMEIRRRYDGFFYTWFDKKDFDESLWRYYWLTDM